MGFVPIAIDNYVQLHVQANPDEDPRELLKRLRSCVSDSLAGARCFCGAPIWVVGSVRRDTRVSPASPARHFPPRTTRLIRSWQPVTSRHRVDSTTREFESRNGGLKNALDAVGELVGLP